MAARPTPTKTSDVDAAFNKQNPVQTAQNKAHRRSMPATSKSERPASPSTRRTYYNDYSNSNSAVPMHSTMKDVYRQASPKPYTGPNANSTLSNVKSEGVKYRTKTSHCNTQSRHSAHLTANYDKPDDSYRMLHSTSYNHGDGTLTRPKAHKKTKSAPFKWQNEQSDSDGGRTNSPSSVKNADTNRETLQKLMHTHYGNKLYADKIQVSQPYNL